MVFCRFYYKKEEQHAARATFVTNKSKPITSAQYQVSSIQNLGQLLVQRFCPNIMAQL
jgi:hypothetical protein